MQQPFIFKWITKGNGVEVEAELPILEIVFWPKMIEGIALLKMKHEMKHICIG